MSGPHQARQPTRAETRLVVTRANGDRVDLGVVSAYYRNPLRRLWWRLVREPAARRRIQQANQAATKGS